LPLKLTVGGSELSEMSITPELETQIHATAQTVKQGLQALAQIDMTPFYQFDMRLKSDKNLLEEFIADPVGVAERETGILAPAGTHMHFINNRNEYSPPEGGALDQLLSKPSGAVWSRVEVRAAVGPGCYAFCFVCTE
jgi:hypothetical protein